MKYPFEPTEDQVAAMEAVVTKGKHFARKIKRANVLLALHEGQSPHEIVKSLKVSLKWIYALKKKFALLGIKALDDRPRVGAPEKLSAEDKAKITLLACSTPPEGHSRWTLKLLEDKIIELKLTVPVSDNTIGRLLKKTNSSPT